MLTNAFGLEIDGDPPTFIMKPRPLTVNAGEDAVLNCKVDGEPTPTVKWLYWYGRFNAYLVCGIRCDDVVIVLWNRAAEI